jgi:hypothetical protein
VIRKHAHKLLGAFIRIGAHVARIVVRLRRST